MPEITKKPRQGDSPVKQKKEPTAGKGVPKNYQTQNASVVTNASRASKTLLSQIKRSEFKDGLDSVSILRQMRDTTRRN